MAIEIVDFPIKNGGSFHSYVTVYQRVNVRLRLDSLVQVLSACRVHMKPRPGPCYEVRCDGEIMGD